METAWTSTPSYGFRPFVRNLLIKLDKICQPTRHLISVLGACPRIKVGQNLTSQNATGSTIGALGGVLLPPKMSILAFLGQAPRCPFHKFAAS